LYLQGGNGCIAQGEKVLLSDGRWLEIEKIKKGHSVVSWNGEKYTSKKVLKQIHSGIKMCYEYADTNNRKIRCTPDHKVIHLGEKNRWKPINEAVDDCYGKSQIASFGEKGLCSASLVSENCIGECSVYDLEVEGSHNFIVNGFVVHNSGKTRALMAPVIEMLTQIPKIRMLWGRADFKDLKLSVMDKFFEVLPSDLIANKNETYHYYDIYAERGTSRIYFNGLSDLTGLGSQEFAVIIITEAHEITEQTYRVLKRRCRQADVPCMILMESEPPNQSHFLADIPAYRGSLESMPEAAKRKYLLGKTGFSVSGKPFYQGFKNNLHTGIFEAIKGKELLVGWDFGYRHPAIVVTQLDLKDRWIWLREFLGRDILIDKFADYIISQLNIFYPGCRKIHFGDPAANQVGDKSEMTSAQILKSKGIDLITRWSSYRQRKEIIEGRLAKLAGDKPMLMLDKRHCEICIDGFAGGYHYPVRKDTQQFEGRFELPFKDGFYEHCLSGDTKIRTLDGWHKIKDLVGKEFITYAYDSFNKRLIPAGAKDCRLTQENVELWKLEFDKGELVATPDHLIMLRDGSYRQLKDLKPNDELMPYEQKEEQLRKELVNHKVVSVSFYGYGDTYNLEVEKYHNFPANGVMVHNCINAAEYIAVNVFTPTALSDKQMYEDLTGLKKERAFAIGTNYNPLTR